MASTAKRTEDCLAELEAQFKKAKTPSSVLLILGRTGAGKSSLLEDLSGLSGYSEQNADSVTKATALCKATINNHPYFIMDTPGFDPGAEQATFTEIARALTSIHPPLRPHPGNPLPNQHCARAIRQFRPQAPPVRPRAERRRPASSEPAGEVGGGLQFGAQELKTYQHGRAYDAGEDTGAVIDWFMDRGRIARGARDMVVRNYGASMAGTGVAKIERELDGDVPIHDTDAGRLLGLPAPSSSSSSQSGKTTDADAPAPAAAGSTGVDSPPKKTGSQSEPRSGWQVFLDGAAWFFRNVEVNVGVGGGDGRGGGSRKGPRFNHGDPFSGGGG
ncbi:uncharacterized protein DSM5745_00365 [Aspergillus mulundensis]|uniref:G domain-containing protein n=1 Tax=Aspergillus mulundensis TaxID=1810919 RepID=A0A3D8T3B5_9EURO|nr:hypothetical protein DSM5745_00365 [Aspergillus mulundensis]RDW93043.1 hypothetical protein DSM5745_00365 [Aspergillus mulundensis]